MIVQKEWQAKPFASWSTLGPCSRIQYARYVADEGKKKKRKEKDKKTKQPTGTQEHVR
jgi:hypothetical protein